MAMTEDFAGFFDVEEFADSATLDGEALTGIFDAGYEDPLLTGYGSTGPTPRFLVRAVDVPTRPEGKPLVISTGAGAGTYRVANVRPDGTGLTLLMLK